MSVRNIFIFTLIFFYSTSVFGQVETTDFLRSMGKMYSVVAVVLLIFAGIIVYLFRLERRIKKLEKK